MTGKAARDVFQTIRDDHRVLRGLVAEIADPERNESSRRSLFEQLKLELRVHGRVEEAILYSRLNGATRPWAAGEIERRRDEHRNLERVLETLDRAPCGSEAWQCLFGRLGEMLERHMREEETETFDSARRVIEVEEARELGEQMEFGLRTIRSALASSGPGARRGSLRTEPSA